MHPVSAEKKQGVKRGPSNTVDTANKRRRGLKEIPIKPENECNDLETPTGDEKDVTPVALFDPPKLGLRGPPSFHTNLVCVSAIRNISSAIFFIQSLFSHKNNR